MRVALPPIHPWLTVAFIPNFVSARLSSLTASAISSSSVVDFSDLTIVSMKLSIVRSTRVRRVVTSRSSTDEPGLSHT